MSLDVAARLAEGRVAVADTQAYVDACRAVGYQNADLTARGGQVDEWYATEDGLDLTALDTDCAALRAAAGAAEEALRIERAGAAAVASAWSGDSGSAAGEFVERHCSAGAVLADAMRSAAEACTALRDKLWGLVDGKVGTVTAIENRHAGERAAWLAAAHSVTTGVDDRAAVEIVRQQIMPYVDGDIRAEWVAAMRSVTAAVDAAYDDAAQALNAHRAVDFPIPARLGPAIAPPPPAAPAAPVQQARPAITMPAAASAPAVPSTPEPPGAPAVPEIPVAPPIPAPHPMTPPGADVGSPFGAGPGTGVTPGGGAGLGSGGGLSALVSEIIDALGGLFDEPDAVDAPDGGDPAGDKPGDKTEDKPDEKAGEKTAEKPATEVEPAAPQPDPTVPDAVEPPVADIAVQPAEPEPEPVPEPAPVNPAPAPPEPDPATPCDIAADELPQVGQ